MALDGVKKRKRVSKTTKLSWRKYSKVSDIEAFLDQQQATEHLEIKDDPTDIIIDTGSSGALVRPLSRAEKKQRSLRPLKCFSALQSSSAIEDPNKKRNRVRTVEERKSSFVKGKEQENKKKGVLKAKESNALAERRLYEIKKEKKKQKVYEDVWNDNQKHTLETDPWALPSTKIHNLRNTGVTVKKPTKDLQKKKSVLPPVEPPHPGMSYNPTLKDHQDLLRLVAEDELKIIKKDEHLDRVTRGMFRKVTESQKQSEWLGEMAEGIALKEEEPSIDIKEEDSDKISINPPVQNKKKTKQQRRKQKEQQALERQRLAKKVEKKKIGDIQLIKRLKTKLEKIEDQQAKVRKVREINKEKAKLLPKVLSKNKFEDPGPEFQMGEDISGNLRAVKKEGNLLADRFTSMQKRNILASTKRVHIKKAKIKRYTKPGHKEDWEKTVARAVASKKQ